ncbi:signal recognition particle 19 kDa protein-like [Glandiceps talaboti]
MAAHAEGHSQQASRPNLTIDLAKKEKWICIYPAYINSRRSLAEGRRIAKTNAVENPTVHEMKDVLLAAGVLLGVENKMYPRDPNRDVVYRGRLRIKMLKEDGTPLYEKFQNKKSILLYLGETIPKLKTRTQKQSGSDSGGQGQGKKKKKKR